MAKKKQSNRSGPGLILGIIVVVIGFIFSAVTGVDIFGVLEDGGAINTSPRISTGDFTTIDIPLGLGYQGDFWQLYFTTPLNTRNRSEYVNGVDIRLAAAIDTTRNTLDIAAFELNNEVITNAIIDAHERGVTVRVVTDDEHGLEDDDSTIVDLELAGIPIVDDERTALMHNKFMIMDGITVWLGSMNYTMNGVYRNNNNAVSLRSRRAVEAYQAEFNEMFERHEFGPRSDDSNTGNFTQDGVPIQIYFASENEVIDVLLNEVGNARSSIRFMTFSFTRDDLGNALLERASAGVDVQGVFETTGSETEFSEMPRLLCAGLDVRQDGNRGILHHKVFIIDGSTVITGSFNYSDNAVQSNDENVLIIRDGDIANLYTDEFLRVQSIASRANDIDC